MQSVEKFNELLEKMNQKVQLELDIKNSLVELTSSFSENYYFQTLISTEHNILGFCFYLPNKEESDNNNQKKSFIEVEVRNFFDIVDDDFSPHSEVGDNFAPYLEFNGFEVKIKQFTAPLDVCLSMMYGQELKANLAPAYISNLVEREDFTSKAIVQRKSSKKLSFIDFISQMNKDHIKPYLDTFKINVDGKTYEQSKADKKIITQEYNEISDKLIFSLYNKKSLVNKISDNEIKEITDLMTHNNYTKMNADFKSKENKIKHIKI